MRRMCGIDFFFHYPTVFPILCLYDAAVNVLDQEKKKRFTKNQKESRDTKTANGIFTRLPHFDEVSMARSRDC